LWLSFGGTINIALEEEGTFTNFYSVGKQLANVYSECGISQFTLKSWAGQNQKEEIQV
jgi:hypothetical protein